MKPSLQVGDILVSYPIYLDGHCSKIGDDNEFDEILNQYSIQFAITLCLIDG